MGEPAFKLGGDEQDKRFTPPALRGLDGGGDSTPRTTGHLRSVDDEPDLQQSEEDGSVNSNGTRADRAENNKLSDKVGEKAYRDEDENKKPSRFSRRQKIGTGVVGTSIIGIVMFLTGLLAGPAEFVHMLQLISGFHFAAQEDQSDVRTTRLIRLLHNPKNPQNVRLTTVGDRIASRLDTRLSAAGITPEFKGSFKYGDGWSIDRTNEKYRGMDDKTFRREAARTLGVPEASVEITNSGAKGNPGKGVRANAKMARGVLKATGMRGVTNWLGARTMVRRTGSSLSPFKKLDRALLEGADAKLSDWRAKREARITKGESVSLPTAEGAKNKDGTPADTQQSKTAQDAVNQTGADSEAVKSAPPGEKAGPISAFQNKLSVKIAGGGAAAVGIACLAKSVANDYTTEKQAKVVLPLIRLGMDAMASGAQVMAGGEVDVNQMGYMHDLMYGKDSSGATTSWTDSASIKANLGESGGSDPSQTLKNINKGTPFDFLNTGPVGTAMDSACSTAGIIIMTGFSAITGPISTIVGGVVSAFALPKAMHMLTQWMVGQPVDPFAKGADFGNQIDYGTVLAANDNIIGKGGVALSSSQVAQLTNMSAELDQNEFSSQSIATRLLDPYEPKSLISQVAYGRDDSPSKIMTSLASGLFSLPKTIASSFVVNTHKASAAGTPYDYGFPVYGFSQADMESPDVDDPYANAGNAAQLFESGDGQSYIDKAKACFGVDIVKDSNGAWGIGPNTESISAYNAGYSDLGCNDSSSSWRSVRFFISDTRTMDSLACFEDDVESCANINASSSTSTAAGLGGNLRVASFNMRGASHTDGAGDGKPNRDYRERMGVSVGVIKDNNIDVVGMQELQPKQYDLMKQQIGDTFSITNKGDHHLTENAIAWNKTKYTMITQGEMPNLKYFSNGPLGAPYVKLKDNTTGQQFYVLNTHDPADVNCNCESERKSNADEHVTFINKLKAEGVPVIFTGDFNNRYAINNSYSPGHKNAPLNNQVENLTYCIMTKNGTAFDAYDLFKKRTTSCTGKGPGMEPGDTGKSGGGIDHIFVTDGITVPKLFWISDKPQYAANGSDHPTLIADLVLPGGNSTAPTGDVTNGIAWPVAKKWWTSNKSDFLNGHVPYSGTFTSPYVKGLADDISSPPKGTPVYSMLDGEVEKVGLCTEGGGMMIKSEVPGGTLHIAYGHGINAKFKVGQKVKAGQQILNLSDLGCQVSGPHLHIDMALGTKHICPQDVFKAMGSDLPVNFDALTAKAAAPCNRT